MNSVLQGTETDMCNCVNEDRDDIQRGKAQYLECSTDNCATDSLHVQTDIWLR